MRRRESKPQQQSFLRQIQVRGVICVVNPFTTHRVRDVLSASEFTQLWQRQAASLVLLARSRCGNPEDCVQEAFIRLATQNPAPLNPAAWLVKVVRNEAISQSRSESRRKKRESAVASQPWFELDVTALDEPTTSDIQNALQELAVDEHEVVVARIWNGLSFRQMADVFEISRSTAQRKYTDALLKLENLLCNKTTAGVTGNE